MYPEKNLGSEDYCEPIASDDVYPVSDMILQIREEVVCSSTEDPRTVAGLTGRLFFDDVDLSDVTFPETLGFRQREFELDCIAVTIQTRAQVLCEFAHKLERLSGVRAVMHDLQETDSRILVASVAPNISVPRRWEASEFTSLELTAGGFRVRDGRFVEKDSVIVREYVDYQHYLESWWPARHLTLTDLWGFANAGMTEDNLLLNLKIQLFDLMPFADFLKTFGELRSAKDL